MLFWILAGLVVYLANIYLPAILYVPTEGIMTHAGSRDVLPDAGVGTQRARRVLVNMQENMPIFLTLGVLALIVEGADMGQAVLGAQLFVLGRIAYTVMYMISIPFTRTAAYMVGLIGCGLMALALI